MSRILVAWEKTSKDAFERFEESIYRLVEGLSLDGAPLQREDVSFCHDSDAVAELLAGEPFDFFLFKESLGEKKIGVGTVRQWKDAHPSMRLIPVLEDAKRGKGKARSLYDYGFFDAIFESDFRGSVVGYLLTIGRDSREAYDYYGLAEYMDAAGNPLPEYPKFVTVTEQLPLEDRRAPAMGKGPHGAYPEQGAEEHIWREVSVVEDAASRPAGRPMKQDRKEAPLTGRQPSSHTAGDTDDLLLPEEDVSSFFANDDRLARETPGNGTATEGRGQDPGNGYETDARDDAYVDPHPDLYDDEKEQEEMPRDIDPELRNFLLLAERDAHYLPEAPRTLSTSDYLQEQLLRHYTIEDNTWISNLDRQICSREEFETELMQRIHNMDIPPELEQETFERFSKFVWGNDILEEYIEDASISDIKVLSPDRIQIKKNGEKMTAKTAFRSPEHYRAYVMRVAKRNHADISNSAIAVFADTKSSKAARLRFNITTEFINSNGYPGMHIRKESNIKLTTGQLISLGYMTPAQAKYFIECAERGEGFVFTGQGSAGKTIGLNWVIDYMPKTLSGLCIQESDELYAPYHPYIQFQRITRSDNEEDQYDLRRLAINGLLTDIDAFIIGEIKGDEAAPFADAAYTDNACFASVHSPGAREALPKIADYAMYGSKQGTKADILKKLSSIKNVVYLNHFKVAEIVRVKGYDEEKRDIIYEDVEV